VETRRGRAARRAFLRSRKIADSLREVWRHSFKF
jgi:hypothetical protein